MNAAEYGFPQRRRSECSSSPQARLSKRASFDPTPLIFDRGVLAKALPVWPVDDLDQTLDVSDIVPRRPDEVTATFWPASGLAVPVRGVMWRGEVWTRNVVANYDGKFQTFADVLLPDEEVPESFFIPEAQLAALGVPEGCEVRGANVTATVTAISTKRVRLAIPTRPTSRLARS